MMPHDAPLASPRSASKRRPLLRTFSSLRMSSFSRSSLRGVASCLCPAAGREPGHDCLIFAALPLRRCRSFNCTRTRALPLNRRLRARTPAHRRARSLRMIPVFEKAASSRCGWSDPSSRPLLLVWQRSASARLPELISSSRSTAITTEVLGDAVTHDRGRAGRRRPPHLAHLFLGGVGVGLLGVALLFAIVDLLISEGQLF